MNDQEEFRVAVKIATQMLRQRVRGKARQEATFEKCEFMIDTMRTLEQLTAARTFACSFSEDGDSLSQWRAYCPRGGFAIGFEKVLLARVATANYCGLHKCEYQTARHRERIEAILQEKALAWVESEVELQSDDDENFRIAASLVDAVFNESPMLKDTAFAEEKEWRFVTGAMSTHIRKEFRARDGLLIPSLSLDLKDAELWKSVEIVVGPTPHAERSVASAELLLDQMSGLAAPVRLTKVPYRYW